MSAQADGNDETPTRFQGYSDYEAVSRSVAEAVDDAVDAWAHIESRHCENDRISEREAAEASSAILGAAIKLQPELQADKEEVDDYAEMLQRWTEAYNGGNGLIERLRTTRLSERSPEWLHKLVTDIRMAAWQLGYLQAGRTVSETDDDPVREGANSMFEGLDQ